jgi:hypothetical protein
MVENVYFPESIETFEYPIISRTNLAEIPLLDEVLENLQPLPAYSLLLGLCEDGLPVILDLTDPSAGGFLISGDNGFVNSTLLYSILTTACKVNTVEEVNLHLISPHADDLIELHRQPHCKISFDPSRPECEIVIEEMVNLVHHRQGSGEIQPIHILAIDGLDLLFQTLSLEAQSWFKWLLQFGPEVGVWIFATIESSCVNNAHYGMIESFPSRILGIIKSPQMARYLSGVSSDNLDDLIQDSQFFMRSGGGTFNMWMLDTDAYKN